MDPMDYNLYTQQHIPRLHIMDPMTCTAQQHVPWFTCKHDSKSDIHVPIVPVHMQLHISIHTFTHLFLPHAHRQTHTHTHTHTDICTCKHANTRICAHTEPIHTRHSCTHMNAQIHCRYICRPHTHTHTHTHTFASRIPVIHAARSCLVGTQM